VKAENNVSVKLTLRKICKVINTGNYDYERYVRAQFEFVKGNLTLLSFLGRSAIDRYNKCETKMQEDTTELQDIIQDVKYSRSRLDNMKINDIMTKEALKRLTKRDLIDPYTLCHFGTFTSNEVKQVWEANSVLRETVRKILDK
jgi:hypothetical protein